MAERSDRTVSPWRATLWRHRTWLLVALTVLFVLVVRVRLLNMPLERDEGEYAYAGQLILHGVPPYTEAYNMKLPGTYAAYAVIMALFGQSAAGIHFGVALVNAASIVLVFLLGRRLPDDAAGVAAAVVFALLSLSPAVLGLAGHATHFVGLAALGGTLLLLKGCDDGPRRPSAEESASGNPQAEARSPEPSPVNRPPALDYHLLLSGVLFGLAFLMKQHGLFFGLFGVLYLLQVRGSDWLASGRLQSQIPAIRNRRPPSRFALPGSATLAAVARIIRDLGGFTLGWLLPYGVTCLFLASAGAFHQFVFWTITYASRYASAIPLVNGPDLLKAAVRTVAGPNLALWLLPWFGALVMWWDARLASGPRKLETRRPRQDRNPRAERELGNPQGTRSAIRAPRFFLTALLFCALASTSVGLYFRGHYFILLLPALALLSGVAVSRALYLLRCDQTIELFLALPILGLFVIGLGAALIGNGSVWFAATPARAVQNVYGTTLFAEAVQAADYVKEHTAKGARLAVLGSEPEIYFYARRRSATGYIYMYPLMEEHDLATGMRQEMIGEIERARPEYVVYVDEDFSWLPRPSAARKVDEWWKNYWAANLDLVKTIQVEEEPAGGLDLIRPSKDPPELKHILIFKRR